MMGKKPKTPVGLPQAFVSVVDAETRTPLTCPVGVKVKALSKKGASLCMDSPFVDGIHILMDVHNTTPKLLRLTVSEPDISGDKSETQLLGSIESYNHLPAEETHAFWVELAWVGGADPGGERAQTLKQLIRLHKP